MTDSQLLMEDILQKFNPNENWLDVGFCQYLDSIDELHSMQHCFCFPECIPSSSQRQKVIYLCGNSLGLQPKKLRDAVDFHLKKWGDEAVEGHFTEPQQWLTIDDMVQDSLAHLVGAHPHEVVAMNSLTCNLHLMMISFYRPTAQRYKIIIEKKAFPSDFHAVESQILLHGLSLSTCLIEVSPREGEVLLRMEDIEEVIRREGPTTALVMFSGVQYYTGQCFDMAQISKLSREYGCCVGFDLAHAIGNVPLNLHAWDCDFAVWCSYKYLNSGPGAIAGCFVHERHGGMVTAGSTTRPLPVTPQIPVPVEETEEIPPATLVSENAHGTLSPRRLAGWWGHRLQDRFQMSPAFIPCDGAYGFRLSNPPVLMVACLRAALDLFDEAGMDRLRRKSVLLTAYLEVLLDASLADKVRILSPRQPDHRGCQLSLQFLGGDVERINEELKVRGVVCDVRKPDVMRVAPTPMYNTFQDVYEFVDILKHICCNIDI